MRPMIRLTLPEPPEGAIGWNIYAGDAPEPFMFVPVEPPRASLAAMPFVGLAALAAILCVIVGLLALVAVVISAKVLAVLLLILGLIVLLEGGWRLRGRV